MIAKDFAKPFYASKAWKNTRRAYINSVNGWCERCLKKKIYRKGYIVHHKVYLNEDNINDPEITLGWDNLEYVCLDCHNAEHFGKYSPVRDDVMFDEFGDLILK